MRVLISGGGTGGHVYPALAVAAQLAPAVSGAKPTPAGEARDELGIVDTAPSILWVGSNDGMERDAVGRQDIPFQAVQTGQLRVTNPLTVVGNAGRMMIGLRQSLALLREFQPTVCLVTGGYVCTPVVVACRLRSVPILIYLPDMSPGLAVRWLSRLAQRVAVSFPEAAAFFGHKGVVTGYPVRAELVDAATDRSQARRRLAQAITGKPEGFRIGSDVPLLLVFGGSQGARSINQTLWSILPDVLPLAYVLHVVGNRDWSMLPDSRPNLSEALASRYWPVAYLHDEMSLALAAADLAVARAGASTLGEFPVAGLPSILVPLPIAGGHQWANAEKLARQGGAVVVEDSALAGCLRPVLVELLQDQARRAHMRVQLADLARPQAASCIAKELARLSC